MENFEFLHPATRTILAAGVLAFVACTTSTDAPAPLDVSVPEVTHLMVDFGRHDSAANRAGAFVFDPSKPKIFYEFNASVPIPGGSKLLPTFEYYLAPDANVYAPASGYVTHFKFQAENGDYEIGITREPTLSVFGTGMVLVDHIKDLTVSQGDFVTAGQVLGKPGPWIEGLSRTELMVYRNDSAFCPFAFMPESLKAGYRQHIRDLMADWEAYKRDTSIYAESGMVEPGCNGWTGIP